jgi:hypothetical protein
MKKGLAELVCIVDRSGSMEPIKMDAIGGFNSFIEDQKKVDGEANVTLVLFDHEYIEVYAGKKLDAVEPLNEETYVPRGMTAFLDAVGRTIVTVGERLNRLRENDKPEKVIVSIVTDGCENHSSEYTKGKIADMIKHQQSNYAWDFVFIAANMDAVAEGTSLNIPAQNTMNFMATPKGTRSAYSSLNATVAGIRNEK